MMGKKRQQSGKHIKPIASKRRIHFRPKRYYFMLVCEGEKTEPNFFTGLKKKLPDPQVELKVIHAGGTPINIVQHAIDQKNAPDNIYDHFWAIFDKDDNSIDRFNGAIRLADGNGIRCAYSVECFELWCVLYFQYIDAAISRNQYSEILTRHLGQPYNKTDTKIYDKLQRSGNEADAIARARRLYGNYVHRSPATENPSTTVFMLVEEINQYMQ